MLHGMQNHRPILALQVQQALHPEQRFAARRHHHLQPGGEAGKREWRIEGQAKGLDAGVMTVRVVVVPVAMPMPVVVIMPRPGLRVDPALYLGRSRGRVIWPGMQQESRFDLTLCDEAQRRARIECAEPRQQRAGRLRAGNIGLSQHQPVGNSRLPDSLRLRIQRGSTVRGVHQRHHAIEAEAARGDGIDHQCLQDGRGISEASRLDNDAPAGLARLDPRREPFQRAQQIAAHRAADATGIEQHGVAVEPLDQQVIEPDFAKLIDQHGCVGQVRMLEQPVEKRRLASAEKAGEHGDGNGAAVDHGAASLRPYSSAGSAMGSAMTASTPSRAAR